VAVKAGVSGTVAAMGTAPMSGEQLAQALKELAELYPSLLWTPNVAQERPLDDLRKKDTPFISILTFGNGTGKTDVLVMDMVGVMLGADFLNYRWYVNEDTGEAVGGHTIGFYRTFDKLRNEGGLRCRIVCDAEDMQENGSLYDAIKRLMPTAQMVSGRGQQIRKIRVPVPGVPGKHNTIDIKTFAQDSTSHAGSNLHRIWINEPPPYPIFSENVRRTRSKKGELSGSIMIAATVLSKAVYIFKLASDETIAKNGKIVVYRGCSWENCCGEDITDEIANEYLEKMGFPLKKGKDGKYVTRGVLERSSIESMIATLEKEYPDEVDAFLWGGNVLLHGSIYKSFNLRIHKQPSIGKIPELWPVFQVVDPHPVKDDASIWAYMTPLEKLRVFAEWPTQPYENLRNRTLNIGQTCELWRNKEAGLGIKNQIVLRIGDPNRFNYKDSAYNNRPLHSLYSDEGFDFLCDGQVVADSLDLGHRLVNTWLWYDKVIYQSNPADPRALPKLTIDESCRNCHIAMQHYGTKIVTDPTKATSETVDEKYKDFADLIRYLIVVVSTGSFAEWSYQMRARRGRMGGGDYELYLQGMEPGDDIRSSRYEDVVPGSDYSSYLQGMVA